MIKTGIKDLDNSIKIKNNDLIVVAGVSGIGKTSFINNIIANTDKEVLVFSLEETTGTLTDKILQIRNINRTRKLEETNQTNDINNINIESNSNITIKEIKKYKDVKLIIIDRIELVKGYNEKYVSKLKELSQELNVPVIVTSQLSDVVIKRINPTPVITDINNKKLVNLANMIIFFHRDDYYNKDSEKLHISEIIIEKPIYKKIDVIWLNHCNKLLNLEKRI